MNRLSLKTKLICSFLILTVLPLIIGIATWLQLNSLSGGIATGEEINQIQTDLLNARRHEKNYFLRKDTKYIDELNKYVTSMLTIAQKESVNPTLTPECRQWALEALGSVKTYSDAFLKQVEADKNSTDASAQSLKEREDAVVSAARKIEENIKKINEAIDAQIINAQWRIKAVNIAITLGALITGITFGLTISISLSHKITVVAETLKSASAQTSSASHEVASSSQELAQGASEQAASLEETSASMEEISATIKSNADNAGSVKNLTTETRTITEKNHHDMESLRQRLGALSQSSNQMTDAMNQIKGSSSSISQIIKTIDEIAFQTNILALNAAVEAARAGEAGAGFAIVADEVRNLAKRSADAARETSTLIEDAIHKSDAGVRVNEEIIKELAGVETNAHDVQNNLQTIMGKVESVDNAMLQIVTASQEQSRGAGEVTGALSQMDKVTQSNAACSEESASAAEELSAQAEELKALAHQLDCIVKGDDGLTPVSAPPPTHTAKPKKAATSDFKTSRSSRPVRPTSDVN